MNLDLTKPLVTAEGEQCWIYDKGNDWTFSARVPDGQVHLYYLDGEPYHGDEGEPIIKNRSSQ